MDNKTKMRVKNRSASSLSYRVTLDNGATLRREMSAGETIVVPYEEILKLSYQPGGKALIANFLLITEVEALADLNIHPEPEYNMSEQDIIDLIRNGSMDAFLDCLDFAPVGVIDLVKQYAVKLPMNDLAKCEALKKATGFDVHKALEMNAPDPEEAGKVEAPTATRRTQPATSSAPTRRTESKYKIVNTPKTEG